MNACPICRNEADLNPVERRGEFTLVFCPSCRVVFADPMKNPGAEWYERSELYVMGKVAPGGVEWHHRNFLEGHGFYGPRLLDVGCGTGAFLAEAKKKNYVAWGIDFDKEALKIAKERGLANVHLGSVAELRKLVTEKFDVITFFEVLEHLEDPSAFLNEVSALLNPGGHIALSVPNRERRLDTLGDGDYPPNHLTRWNLDCLSSFLEKNGFEIVEKKVKRLGAEETAAYLKMRIRLGLARRMAVEGVEANRQDQVRRATALMKTKDLAFDAITVPLEPFMKMLNLPGTGLYVLARLR